MTNQRFVSSILQLAHNELVAATYQQRDTAVAQVTKVVYLSRNPEKRLGQHCSNEISVKADTVSSLLRENAPIDGVEDEEAEREIGGKCG